MDMDRVMITSYPNVGAIATRVPASSVSGMRNLPCKDGFVMLIAMTGPQWESIFDIIGNPEWVEVFREDSYRDTHMPELMDKIAEWTKNMTKGELYREAQRVGCPAGPVRSAEEVVKWEQPRSRGFFVEVDHPVAGRFEYPRAAYHLSETPVTIDRPAPLLGQHNEEIFTRLLGRSRDDLVKLREAGVI